MYCSLQCPRMYLSYDEITSRTFTKIITEEARARRNSPIIKNFSDNASLIKVEQTDSMHCCGVKTFLNIVKNHQTTNFTSNFYFIKKLLF